MNQQNKKMNHLNKYLGAAVFSVSTFLASPAQGVATDGEVCLYVARQKHQARQALPQETSELERLLENSKECSKVEVSIRVKGHYSRDSTGSLICQGTDDSAGHRYDLAGVKSVAIRGSNQVEVSFKKGKSVLYTLPDEEAAKKTEKVFQDVMGRYWTLKF